MQHNLTFQIASKACAGAFVAAALGLAFPANAQTKATPTFVAMQVPTEHNVTGLVGSKVVNDANEVIGDINFVLMDNRGQVTTVTIGVGGFLGVGEKNVGVPFSALTVTDGDKGVRVVHLKATKQEIVAAPKFQWLETPMSVQVEEAVKSAADQVKSVAKDVGKKASDAMKTEKPAPIN